MTHSKKINYIDLKDFQFTEKKLNELCNICEQEMLKSNFKNFFSKKKKICNALFEYIYIGLGYFIFTI